MPRESLKSKRERAATVALRMNERYGEAETELIYDGDPFHLVIAVLLSAQTTDKAVNKVTPVLWERYPTIEALAQAKQEDVEEILRSIGFFRTKAAHVIECARIVLEDFKGNVPSTMGELTKLPGVGRKTANIVLNVAFDDVEGIAVDTHVFRITHMLKLSNAPTPQATEFDLLKVFDRKDWKPINHQLVRFGREVCVARRPRCNDCELSDICPSAKKSQ
ncbi:MAG: endonuclease III [Eggerthellaceae bacterium]|nr:endonuclease III [Eggerthellaceae bacterium]